MRWQLRAELRTVRFQDVDQVADSVAWTYQVLDSEIDFLDAGQTATIVYSVTVDDGNGGLESRDVTITVEGAQDNTPPVAVADAIAVAEGGTATLLASGAASVLANDTDGDGDPLTAVLVTGPANGALVLNDDGTFSYTHNGGEAATDSFTYRANDGTADGGMVTVTIAIAPVNDAPVAVDDSFVTDEDTSAHCDLPPANRTIRSWNFHL